ncbi:hypothetical protein NM688_g1917 [Phlebia brevispora]|uniref:Uncharacterized protein n=1 Tax=Phlebia brevispora TaxID=194682 RepID=A0ACC1T9Y9_9APHY|nr:hypothetical protein NM688_g1917 [Phlebia brevispora]
MSLTRELFGGAITVNIPTILIDASNLRQIPDTQEVFLHPKSGESLIVEVLQSVDRPDPQEAAKFHFESLAHDNSAVGQQVHETSVSPTHNGQTPAPVLLYGTQLIPKFNATTPDEVQILLALYRVPNKHVDLVMTMNVPTKAADGGAVTKEELAEARRTFEVAASSLNIVKFELFA